MREKDIHAILRLVKQEVRLWPAPVLGVLAAESATPFQILIACVLSLRTKDQTTKEASHRLFALASTPLAMGNLKLSRIEKAIYPVCFYRTKSKQIHDICHKLTGHFHGQVPTTIDELLTLNGVGRKTANLVVTVGFGQPGICVDVHVHRICNRWGYIKSQSANESELILRSKLPQRYWITFNDLLVPFGQNICRPVSPICSECRLKSYCRKIGVRRSR